MPLPLLDLRRRETESRLEVAIGLSLLRMGSALALSQAFHASRLFIAKQPEQELSLVLTVADARPYQSLLQKP
jgi:hypothetical protein